MARIPDDEDRSDEPSPRDDGASPRLGDHGDGHGHGHAHGHGHGDDSRCDRRGPAGPLTGVIELPEGSWWDWDVWSWRPGELRLAAGYDLGYHHGLELVFADPLYVRCPDSFQDPVFRSPTPEERWLVGRQCGEEPGVLVAFEADGGGAEPVSGLIAAGSLEVRVGSVLRYLPAPRPADAPEGKSAGRTAPSPR